MYAIEFESKIDNGILKVPIKYKKVMQCNKVRVIIMIENEEIEIEPLKSVFGNFLKTSKKIENIKRYSKDELHER